MKINGDMLVGDIPIRFLPECTQGLKYWLTSYKRELFSMNDLIAERRNRINYQGLWLSPSAGSSLADIFIEYSGIKEKPMVIKIPRKYESQVDFDKFIIE